MNTEAPHALDTNKGPERSSTLGPTGVQATCDSAVPRSGPKMKRKSLGDKLTCFLGRDATPLGSGRGSAQVRLPCRLATAKLSVVPDASIPPAPGRVGF